MWIEKAPKYMALAGLLATVAMLAAPAAQAAEIYRDANNVPQIYGKNNFDLFAGYGYVAGHDRLFQLEMRRRQAYGTTADVLGAGDQRWPDKYIEKDTEARRNLNIASFQQQLQDLDPADHEILDGYVTGLNRAIDEALTDKSHKLSKQFIEYGFLPSHWSALDVLVTSASELAYYSDLAFQSTNFTLYNHLRQKFPNDCDDVFDQLLWTHDPLALTTMQDQASLENMGDLPAPKGCANNNQLPNGLLAPGGTAKLMNTDTTPPYGQPRRASMAWAVGSKMASDARSIFLNGPQTGWHRPSYYYVVGLHGGDFDFVGMAPSALLPMEVGASANHSWGMTAGLGMQKDLFQERLKPNNHNKYLHNGQWLKFTHRHEIIDVKDSAPVDIDILTSIHGPVTAEADLSGVAYTQSTAWKGGEVRSIFAWLHAAHARTKEEWLADADHFDFNYNWFYSDNKGEVGFAYTGKFPNRRPDLDVRLPVSGTGAYDYQGSLDQTQNPHWFTRHYISNFNNKPTRNWPNSGLFFEQWGKGNQAEILAQIFTHHAHFNLDQIWDINRHIAQADVNAHPLMPFIALAAKQMLKNSEEAKAAALMLNWNMQRTDSDHDGFYDSPGQVIFDAWLPIMVRNTLSPALDGWDDAGYWLHAGYQTRAPRLEEHPSAGTMALIEALNFWAGHGAVPQYHDFFQGEDPLETIIQSLHQALAELHKTHNGSIQSWHNPVVIQRYFNTNAERIPMTAQGPETNFGPFANRGVINLLTEYDKQGHLHAYYVNPLGGADFIPPSQDHDEIPDYNHQLDLYTNFNYAPVYLKKVDVLNHLGPTEPVEVDFR